MKIPAAKLNDQEFIGRLEKYLGRVGVQTARIDADSQLFGVRVPGGEWVDLALDANGSLVTPSELDRLILPFVDAGNDLFLDAGMPAQPKNGDIYGAKSRAYLRDKTAMLAAECMLPNYQQVLDQYDAASPDKGRANVEVTLKVIARFSYEFADAMMAARDK